MNARVIETREKRDSLAGVFLAFANVVRANSGRVELHTIQLNGRLANVNEHLLQPVGGVIAEAEKVEVASRPDRLIGPHGEEHRALQDELVGVLRLRKPVQQPFEYKPRLQVIERRGPLVAEVQ